MNVAFIVLIAVIVFLIIIKKIIGFGLKIFGFVVFLFVLAGTIWIACAQPDMHKPFSVNTIEYLFKINKDGSLTTTKQITETTLKEQVK